MYVISYKKLWILIVGRGLAPAVFLSINIRRRHQGTAPQEKRDSAPLCLVKIVEETKHKIPFALFL